MLQRKIAQAGDRTHDLLTKRPTRYQQCQRPKPTGKGSNHSGQSQNTLLHKVGFFGHFHAIYFLGVYRTHVFEVLAKSSSAQQ